MNEKTVYNLKLARLIIASLMIVTIIVYWTLSPYYELPKEDLVITLWVSLFVFLLGLQYKIEEKNKSLPYFLMLFSIMMIIMSIVGFLYV